MKIKKNKFTYTSSIPLILSFGVMTSLLNSSRFILCSTIEFELPKSNCSFCFILSILHSSSDSSEVYSSDISSKAKILIYYSSNYIVENARNTDLSLCFYCSS